MKQQAANDQKVANYNAAVQDQNAALQVEAGRDALARGANDAATIKQNFKQANASARAQAGSTGILVDQGQYGDLVAEGSAIGELNALTARNNAEREAYGFKLKANDYTAQGRNMRLSGDVGVSNAAAGASVAKSNAFGSAASTLVTGASGLAKNGWTTKPWEKWKW